MAHLPATQFISAQLISDPMVSTTPQDQNPLHVASLVIHVRPDHLTELKIWLLAHDGVEVHAESEQGKLVVVMETHDQQKILDLIDSAHERPGALNAALVYHEILTEEHGA